jgi:hypothetical protein
MRRRLSLATVLLAGTATAAIGVAAFGQDAAQNAGQDVSAPGQLFTARVSERFTADSNYRLDDPSPGTSYYADTRLVLGFDRNTGTQTFGLGLDTGLRALWEAQQNFQFTVASPTGANLNFTNAWADGLFDAAVNYRQRQVDSTIEDLQPGQNLDQLQGNTREMFYNANIGVTWGTSSPSSYELRFLGNHYDYSDSNTNKVPRTTLEGQGTWNLQLNPVLASQVFLDYLHYDADNTTSTELANADLTAGLVYQPDENFQVSGGLGYSQRKRWDTVADNRDLTQDNQGPVVRGAFSYRVPDNITFSGDLRYTTAAPDPQLSGNLRAVYVLPRGQLSGRIFQNYAGTDTGGQEARVNGIAVGFLHNINDFSSFSLNAAYATQVDVDDTVLNPAGPDIFRTNVTAIYSHDLTDTVSADIGYRYRHREEDPQSADSHAVFFEIGKSFSSN